MRQNLVKVKGDPNYARVKGSNVVLNINKNEIYAAKERKQKRLESEK